LEAVTLMAGLIGDLKNNPPPTTELATRVTASLGARTATLTTTQGILAQVSRLVIYDRPLSTLATFDAQVRAITPAQVQQFAQRYLGEAHIVIVGPAAKFSGPLQARFGPAQRVPYRLFVKSLLGR
jgi:predicted Zn-dependent peptidase